MRYVTRVLRKEVLDNLLPLLAIILFMLATVSFDLIEPWPFKILIDNVLSATPIEPGTFLSFLHTYFPTRDLLGFFAVFVYFSSSFALALVEYLQNLFTKQVIRNMTAHFSKTAFKNLETLAIGFYGKQKIGDYIYRLGYDVTALGELLEEGVLPFITSSLYLVATIGIMLLINVRLTLLSLAVLPFLALGLQAFNKRVARATKRSEYWSSATYSFIEEALSHLKVIQAFTQENKESEKFDSRIDISLTKDVDMYQVDFLLTMLVGIVIALSYSTVIMYGIYAVFAGTLTTGLLIVFIFYLDNLTSPITQLIYAATTIRTSYTKIMRMEDFFSAKSHLDYHKGGVKHIPASDIRFEHVTLLGDEGKKILDNLSFTIEGGKRTVIFGGSGSGKTSVANLILRFVDAPSHGHIKIGGIPIEQYDIEALRHGIAYVPQEITLFNDSIFNNIILGSRHRAQERVEHASALADANTFITKLPGGYHFKVGESGGFLSGGQRQRIMLARAFMKDDAPILIFDETFSALDVKTRKKVLDNVHEFSKGKTTILISNIFDVIGAADNIIVLNHGKLLYSGPAKRLPREISLYHMIMDSEPSEAI